RALPAVAPAGGAALQGARAAAARVPRVGLGRADALEVEVALLARLANRIQAGWVIAQHPVRQALRADVDRVRPDGPLAARADDDLRGAATDVDDRDTAASGR